MFKEIGAWKSYEELEESLTLDELLYLYSEVISSEVRNFQNTVLAFGGSSDDLKPDFGADAQDGEPKTEDEGDTFENLMQRVAEKSGGKVKALNPQEEEARELRGMKIGYKRGN